MNEYFTKEYIELAKDKRIQGLRATVEDLKMGDYFYDISIQHNPIFIIGRNDKAWCRPEITWLPTGDQLDGAIVKLNPDYSCRHFYSTSKSMWLWYATTNIEPYIIFENTNPLIARINLLLQLIGDE